MKRLLATSFFIATFLVANGQFSISAKYGINSFPEWESIVDGSNLSADDFMGDGLEYGFSYWFRLKNHRVEFMPEISYGTLNAQSTKSQSGQYTNYDMQSFFLTFNTLVYTLDIDGDCNCPTWGKDGSFIQKGFFVGVNPGIGYHSMSAQIKDPLENTEPVEINKFAFRIGVSTGLDIGITKWITLTPYATLNYTPALTWDNLANIATGTKPGEIATKIWQVQPGLRLTFRPDYLKEQRGMFR